MPTLFLHLGMGKTGSSFLQSIFAANSQLLLDHGITYPMSETQRQVAAAGKVTSGNRALFQRHLDDDRDAFLTGPDRLYSNETMLELFDDATLVARLADLKARGTDIRLLIFVRNPGELLMTSYLQRVQQQDVVASFESFAKGPAVVWQSRALGRVRTLIKTCSTHGFDLHLHNYSRVRSDLLPIAKQFLGLPEDITLSVPARVVNRTVGALEVGVNQGLARSFSGLEPMQNRNYTRRLVDATASLKVPRPHMDEAVISDFLATIRDDVEATNAVLPEAAKYTLSVPDQSGPEDPYGAEFGEMLAQEAVRATLLTLERNLDPAGQAVVLGQVLRAGLDDGTDVIKRYVQLLIRFGKHADALEAIGAFGQAEGKLDLIQHRVTCLMALDRSADALAAARSAFDRDPDHRHTGPTLVNALHMSGDTDAARSVLKAMRASGFSPQRLDKLEARLTRPPKAQGG